MSIHVLKPSAENDPVQQAKIDLAAAHRLAALHDLEEGIDNHFTVTVRRSLFDPAIRFSLVRKIVQAALA